MNTPILRFLRRGELVSLTNVPPDRTLLELLREDLGCTGTKEGCGEGDCGACTVVLGEADGSRLKFSAVNSCIRLAHSVNGLALWTVEDIASADGTPHPVQQAMVQCHATAELHIKVTHLHDALGAFSHNSKSFWQQIVQRRSVSHLLFESLRFGSEGFITDLL